jgi:alkylhydroperoxidase family enzyme
VQRSVRSGSGNNSEAKYAHLLHFADSDAFSEREKSALTYTSAIIWDASIADDALWARLHQHFTNAELVELGFFVGLTLGQQRWIKTLELGHQEFMPGTSGGLAVHKE